MSTIIKIAPDKATKEKNKQFQKDLDFLGSEKTVVAESDPTKKVVQSRRNYDHFVGGPLDGMECSHQPNGRTLSFDPGRFWADYFFKDTMSLPGQFRRVTGFHMYSSSRALMYAHKHGIRHKNHKGRDLNIGTRGPNFVKLYYYCGFFEDEILYLDGIRPDEFTGILTLS